MGKGVGLQGQSYAIPTMHGGVDAIKPYVDEFISFTKLHPEFIFLVTKIGCGIAGFKDEEIAPLFAAAIDVENIILPKSFVCVISTAERYAAEMSTMKFKTVRIKLFREDEEKLKSMTREEKNVFMQKIREEHRYTVIRMELVQFLGWKGCYALFSIKREILPNGEGFDKILVAHEGHWVDSDGMICHPEYEHYEDVQKDLGKGLTFIRKEYSENQKRSLFLFDFEDTSNGNYVLAVPATGEEIYFEIYGVDQSGALVLLLEREL